MKKGVFRLFILFLVIVVVFSAFSNINVQKQNIPSKINPSVVSGELKYGYVTDGSTYFNTVTVFNRETMQIIQNITVGYLPLGIVTSPNGSYIYVSNYNSNNVSVISTASNTVIKSINVGNSPGSIGITPNGLFVVVGNSASGTVNIINTKTYTNYIVNVGGNPGGYLSSAYATSIPDGVAFSPNNTFAYVSNADGNISVINLNTMSLFKQITVSNYPVNGLAISSNGNYLYALVNEYYESGIDYGSHLSVISTKTFSILKNISTDWDPSSIALGPGDYNAYVTSYSNSTVSVLNLTTNTKSYSISLPSNAYPVGIYLSPENNSLYVADNGMNNISIINLSTNTVSSYPIGIYPMGISFANLYTANFIESGLPSGTSWSVNVNSISLLSNKTNITFFEPNGSYSYKIGLVPGYKPSPSSGTFIVNGANLNILIKFTIVTYSVKFVESGLPSGTLWSVALNGTTHNSTTNTITFTEPNGSYSYTIKTPISGGTGIQYVVSQSTGTLTVNGTNINMNVPYTTQYYLTMIASPSNGGTVSPSSGWYNAGSSVTIDAISNSNFEFVSWSGTGNGSYSGTNNPASITINGPITETANFIELYKITFVETGLPSGTTWYVNLSNGQSFSGTGTTITINEPNETYSYTVATVNKNYAPSPSSGSFTVNGANVNISITFTLMTYNVTFTESGLPAGTFWSVTLNGNTESSTTNTITFNEVNGTYSFTVGSVSGYTVSPSSGTITVKGANVNQAITFTSVTTSLYTITFTESGLPTGTSWSVTLNGIENTSTTTSITFYEPNGTYTYSIQQIPGYSTAQYSGTITVSGSSITKYVIFIQTQQNEYFIIFQEKGLPTGTSWSVTLNGTTKNTTGTSITFIVKNGTYNYKISLPPGYSAQYTTGTINVEGKSLVVPLNVSKSSPFPWLLIILIVIIIIVVIVILFILMRRKKPGQYGQGPGYYGQQAPPGPPPNYPPPQQQYPGPYPGPIYQEQTQMSNQNIPYQVNQQNQNVQPQSPQVQGMQGIGQGEMILLNLPGASLTTVDGRKISTIPYSGSIVITDKHFIFASKGKKATAITGALAGGIFGGMVSKEMTKVDLSNIQQELTEPGSFILDLSNISSIIAKPSGLSRFSNGKVNITSKVPVSLNGLGITGYAIEFSFMPKGYPGGTDLKKNMADYINTTIAQMVGK